MPASADFGNIRALTFDAAQTLLHPEPSVGETYREVMRAHGLDYDAASLQSGFQRSFSSVKKDWSIRDGEARERAYWRAVALESIRGLDPQPADFDSLFAELWDVFAEGSRWRVAAGAHYTLKALRERGHALCLLSNWDSRVRRVLDETRLAPLLDELFISSEVGYDKPDPRIFQHVECKLGLEPSQILHIGDSLKHDIQGARSAGWHAMQITEKPSGTPGPSTIRSLGELLERF